MLSEKNQAGIKIHFRQFTALSVKFLHIQFPDARLNQQKHCQMKNTLYSPNSNEDEAVKALEEELEDAVARYAQDNILVVRVRKLFSI